MAELKQLLIKRGQQKAVLTRTDKFIQNLKIETFDQTVQIELELRLKKLEVAYEVFNEVQNKIELVEGDDTSEIVREEFETAYFNLNSQIRTMLINLQKLDTSQSESGSEPSSASPIPSTNPYIIPQIHLPLSKLPVYNGEYDKWVEFRDTFQALVDSNPIITKIQKFTYLKSCLGTSVLQTIQAIPITAANYELAWEALRNRYEKNQLIRQSHVKAILGLPKLTRESARDLRNFYNTINNNLESLRSLEEPVDHWDLLLIPIVVEKLDQNSQREWEVYSTKHNSSKLSDFFQLINSRCDILEKLENHRIQLSGGRRGPNQLVHLSHTTQPIKCLVCDENHPLYFCSKFLQLTPQKRRDVIKNNKRCFNCLNYHRASECKSTSKCKKCGMNHNTLLHFENSKNHTQMHAKVGENSESFKESIVENKIVTQNMSNTLTSEFSSTQHRESQVLLSTAMIIIYDNFGNKHECRALLDNGAMSNFITKGLQQRLGLQTQNIDCTIQGIGQATNFTNLQTTIQLKSKFHSFSKAINCLVIDKITSNIPSNTISLNKRYIPKNTLLADSSFNISKPVDLLLGSAVFWEILLPQRKTIPSTNLIMQNTKLGWVVGGSIKFSKGYNKRNQSVNCVSVKVQLKDQLEKFWVLDEVPKDNSLRQQDDPAEQIFKNTITKSADGKFVVSIPFKSNFNQLGHSNHLARTKFYALEKRLSRNPLLKKEYSKFMQEYIDMNHMSPIQEKEDEEEASYYIPHHCICRKESLTTKLRVVFNASMKTDSGLSLNDVQYPGPVIQNDLTILLLNFRIHPYVMTADISKMYRMIWINSDQTPFQRIFWRNDSSENLQCYELKTVTYGTSSAPFLAIRCLHQLATENQNTFPEAANIIRNNFYVDDLICGASSEEKLVKYQREVSHILKGAGFELRKWLTNNEQLYDRFSINPNLECSILGFGDKDTNKTLGIAWNSTLDTIQFSTNLKPQANYITKRHILSQIAKIFDPLGLLGPIIVVGKLIMQKLWQEKVNWDEKISNNLEIMWRKFKNDIETLNKISIPRHVILSDSKEIELHGFGDASSKAYGAAIYLVSKVNNSFSSRLLCSRSRVAPLKQQSLPRLELCAAVLVAQLATRVINSLEITINKNYYWTDSTITLAWLQACPSKWKTFVANRVAEVQRLTKIADWYHIASQENPADRLSRGCTVEELQSCKLWWHGPLWLRENHLPLRNKVDPDLGTQAEVKLITKANIQTSSNNIVSKFSTLVKLRRVLAYCFRFINNCKLSNQSRKTGDLEIEEIQQAMMFLLKQEQRSYLTQDWEMLRGKKYVTNKSTISSLNPFLHSDGLIRVGGRIGNSNFSFEKKHPVILPKHSKLTKLILEDFHIKYYHCGPTQLLAAVRELYWPIAGKELAKKIFRSCVVCTKLNPKPFVYQMGNLPANRVTPSSPFTHVGVDYAGPFQIKDRITRNYKILKGYVCVFICFSTKAMHLELVSDLTTACFLDALKRFISRRGKPNYIYSDNAKTFIGASGEIKHVYNFLEKTQQVIRNSLADEQIQWSFIPPRAPHFGGIWEAGVKSVKHYMVRIMKDHIFTFEQFTTVLCQIESILNSRPLCPLSSDPIEPLTPGHFLIQKPPMSAPVPVEPITSQNSHIKIQYKVMQQIIFQFWVRWKKEYIAELQRRAKWKNQTEHNINIGDIVILKEDATPPFKWPLAKIIQLHPGKDGIARVATIQIGNKTTRRPLTKLCPLPKE